MTGWDLVFAFEAKAMSWCGEKISWEIGKNTFFFLPNSSCLKKTLLSRKTFFIVPEFLETHEIKNIT